MQRPVNGDTTKVGFGDADPELVTSRAEHATRDIYFATRKLPGPTRFSLRIAKWKLISCCSKQEGAIGPVLLQSLLRAFFSLLHPRMLALMIWPTAAALVLWIALAATFWGEAVAAVDATLRGTPIVEWMYTVALLAAIAAHLGWILLALLFVPLVLVTVTLIVGVFSMPIMVNHVSADAYPQLMRRRGGGMAGGVLNTLVAMLWFAALATVTVPLWLAPPLWPVLPVVLIGYLNYRMFPYDALAEHASGEELERILRRDRGQLFSLGVAVAIVGYVPLLGLFAPLFGGLAFIHYGLARLNAMRSAPIDATVIRVD